MLVYLHVLPFSSLSTLHRAPHTLGKVTTALGTPPLPPRVLKSMGLIDAAAT